ncbi:tetratricopeptide repeat protein [Arenibacterium sp. LLYu02]|uniref:tetratricopeptide repeat protein n=1 Tax=Arenibacterium sp. LLYu02 TaxID=3404132 RepID=UPI003B22898E
MRFALASLSGALATLATAGFAECPAAPDHGEEVAAVLSEIRAAETEGVARVLGNSLWELWTDAPDEAAQALLNRGMSRRSGFDFLGALEDLDALVAYCPAYAEGYNQRAFVYYLQRDFAAALRDLDRALALSPNHVAALSGRALSLYGLSQLPEAKAALEAALALNPWLPERHLLAPGGPLHTLGQDI